MEKIAFEYRKDEPFRIVKDGCIGTIRTMEGGGVSKYIMEVRLGNIFGFDGGNYAGNVYDQNYMCPTLNTMQGGCKQPMIIEDSKCVGGLGEKKSNGGTQYYQQDRVYHGDIALAHLSQLPGGSYNYVVEENKIEVLGNYQPSEHDASRVVHPNGIAPTVKENHGTVTGIVEKVKIKQATKDGYIECKVGGGADLSFPNSATRRGRVIDNGETCPTIQSGENGIHRIELNPYYLSDKGKKYVCDPKRGMCTDINADVCQTLTAKGQSNWTGSFVSPDIERLEKSSEIKSKEPTRIHLKNGETITSNDDLSAYRIRKLTPKECWRLMNFSDEDFHKAESVCSNSQLYKQAGNSIVKNVLVAIFGQMIEGKENVYKEKI